MNPFGVLPKKSDQEVPTATSDNHYAAMASDPSIPQIPQGSTYDGAMRSQGFTPPNYAELVKSSGGAMQEGQAEVLVKTDDKFGKWINSRWRPLMSVVYMTTCFCDFVAFPILWSLLQTLQGGQVTSQWMPLTLQGAGLYHIALGAILGVAAYGRTQEKVAGKA
jgi:hypothetical protein